MQALILVPSDSEVKVLVVSVAVDSLKVLLGVFDAVVVDLYIVIVEVAVVVLVFLVCSEVVLVVVVSRASKLCLELSFELFVVTVVAHVFVVHLVVAAVISVSATHDS